VGGPAIMSDQLGRLAEVSELANVSLRVVPFSAGLHPGLMSGPFVILRFPLNGDGRESGAMLETCGSAGLGVPSR
jgi:hypothetical protein